MNQEEYRIHKACIDYLDQRVWKGNKIIHRGNPAFDDLLFFHVQNVQHTDNEEENIRQGLFAKQLGVLAGAYDILCFWPIRMALAYDCKRPEIGKLTTPQIRFRERWERCGFPSDWGTSPEHLRDTLIKHGARCRVHSVKQVDLRTLDQKKQDAFDYFKPRGDKP